MLFYIMLSKKNDNQKMCKWKVIKANKLKVIEN